MSVERRMANIHSLQDPKEQIAQYQSLTDEIVAAASLPNLQAFVAGMFREQVSQQVARAVLVHFAKAAPSLPGELFESIANDAISAMKQSAASLDEADYILRDALFSYSVSQEEFRTAAQTLAGVDLESQTRPFTEYEKADVYVKCAEAFLADDETVDAEVFVNKASTFMNSIEDWALQLRYRATYARVLDANRKFVEAAGRYYELSRTANQGVNQGDLLELLGKAVTCAVLGKSGPPRDRVLGLLCKDERLSGLETLPGYSSHVATLTKMYMQHLLKSEELEGFNECLMPHQKAMTADGFTQLEKAVVENNMLAASRVYDNISFEQLGYILRMDSDKAARVAAKMITEERLKATIDQTEGILLFQEGAAPGGVSFDARLKVLCDEVTVCCDIAQGKYAMKMSE